MKVKVRNDFLALDGTLLVPKGYVGDVVGHTINSGSDLAVQVKFSFTSGDITLYLSIEDVIFFENGIVDILNLLMSNVTVSEVTWAKPSVEFEPLGDLSTRMLPGNSITIKLSTGISVTLSVNRNSGSIDVSVTA